MRKYKLDEIVREYLIESVGASQLDQKYSRCLQIAISGLRDLNRDVNGVIKVERITVDTTNFIATLPNTYLAYRKIFVCSGGQQVALALNPNMCPPENDDCGDLTVPGLNDGSSSSEGFFFPFSSNVPFDSNGSFTGRQYGVGGGNNGVGYFKIYEQEGYISLQNVNTAYDEIMMEYLSDIDQVDGETYVHPNDVEAVKAWIYWKWIQRGRSYPMGEKEMARKQYGLEKGKSRKRHNSFNITDLMSTYRSGFMSSPKI